MDQEDSQKKKTQEIELAGYSEQILGGAGEFNSYPQSLPKPPQRQTMPSNMRGSRQYPDKSFVNLGDSFSMAKPIPGESPLTRYT